MPWEHFFQRLANYIVVYIERVTAAKIRYGAVLVDFPLVLFVIASPLCHADAQGCTRTTGIGDSWRPATTAGGIDKRFSRLFFFELKKKKIFISRCLQLTTAQRSAFVIELDGRSDHVVRGKSTLGRRDANQRRRVTSLASCGSRRTDVSYTVTTRCAEKYMQWPID